MLTITDMGFTLAGRRLFNGASARVPMGAKVGVVGRNGCGKSTLFRLIEGTFEPDQGSIVVRAGARLGGVAQEAPASSVSLIDTVLEADRERAALLAEAETATEPARISDIQLRLTDIDAHSAEARAAAILAGLGFDQAAQARACSEFSGGWRMRVALAAVLFSRPDLLLLDEPTNYLDLEGTVWLENFLARYPATALVISHDRGLLNRSVGAILSVENGRLTYTPGDFDNFDRLRRERAMQAQAEATKQEAARAHMQSFVDRFRAKASKAKQAQSRLKMLSRLQPITLERGQAVAPFRFPQPEELAPPLIALDRVSVGYGGKPVLRDLSLRIDPDDRIALLGANGQGKSTLSKLIAGRLAALSGDMTKPSKMRIGFFAQHQLDELVLGETPVQHIQRLRPTEKPSQLRARLGGAGIGAEIAETPVEKLSGGQKARLLMALMALDAPHILILDEPTNHLDMESREQLALALNDYDGAVILVSHDPFLVEAVADRLWLVKDGAVRPFAGDMDDYRDLLLGGNAAKAAAKTEAKAAPKQKGAERRRALAPLRAEVSDAEARMEKLADMRAKIDALLADPELYTHPDPKRFETLTQKRAEIENGIARAEALWLAAQERLEAAEREAA
ncbi:ABC-F family ATP-binding cassette domain-containing protein [Rubrimonas cliftonensis]|uniref:ATP-binding cassette, subfamily F, member 3 n=1 Tax=Rubrimonas cliftonensis TaxID=89524 RepID=A0A1H3XE45_9RHOB|nr:ABC-F family ATP-binding cassette domain-containing protein [Rubrimonas cliftonensis]SDZ97221.1 ATP-binding cassette, subfamily F, member 3 [Rubrimonas cliftonensis]